MIDQSSLKNMVTYSPDTGLFYRIGWCDHPIGKIDAKGYRSIRVLNKYYRAHRLAFIYMGKDIDNMEVDHINGKRDDNRSFNLRLVTSSENNKNKRKYKTNKSGFTGVCFNNSKEKWHAQIYIDKKCIHLGYFSDKNSAIIQRKKANIKYGFHTNHGML